MRRGFVVFLLLLFSVSVCFGVDRNRVSTGAAGDWVVAREGWRTASTATSARATSGGYVFHLLDTQIDVEAGATYTRRVYEVTSAQGVQGMSQVGVSFDPEYETIQFHDLRVHRGGQVSDRLDLAAMQLIQQERDLERFQYNGQYTALFLLSDVRVGDVIECSYTRKGRNPVFNGAFSHVQYTSWNVPIRAQYLRVSSAPERSLQWKEHGPGVLRHSVGSVGDRVVHEWTATNVGPVEFEDNVPGWHPPMSLLQITDFAAWTDVVQWALPLYTTVDNEDTFRAETLRAAGVPPAHYEAAQRLLGFVQEEIRYLGMELGPRSHAPSTPDAVLKARYGDCKDKARLLCAMLSEVGVEAVPALVHSTRGRAVSDWLPSIDAFDHVIVRITARGRTYWVDPTLTNQAGDLAHRALPEYTWALPIDRSTTRLEKVQGYALSSSEAAFRLGYRSTEKPFLPEVSASEEWEDSRPRSEVDVFETFRCGKPGEPAQLEVQTTYRGRAADAMRGYLRQTAAEEVGKHFFNTRVKVMPSLVITQPLSWQDYPSVNEVRILHSYRVDELWKKAENGKMLTAEFFPLLLYEYVTAPEGVKRSSPYALNHPLRVVTRTLIITPEPWPVADQQKTVSDAAFRGRTQIGSKENTITLQYDYTTLADHVAPERMPEFAAHLAEFRTQLGYTLTFDPVAAARSATFRLNWIYVSLVFIAAGFWTAFSFWLVKRPWKLHTAPAVLPPANLVGLGGWLIVVGLGLIFRLITQLVTLVRDHQNWFDARVWEQNPAGIRMSSSVALVLQLGLVALFIVTLISFFRKQRLFPVLFVANFGAVLLFHIADAVVYGTQAEWTQELSYTLGSNIGSLIVPACIWLPYIYSSRRVKATFVHPPKRIQNPVEPPPLELAPAP
jgi:transglutaminase-like putative cysteine protease